MAEERGHARTNDQRTFASWLNEPAADRLLTGERESDGRKGRRRPVYLVCVSSLIVYGRIMIVCGGGSGGSSSGGGDGGGGGGGGCGVARERASNVGTTGSRKSVPLRYYPLVPPTDDRSKRERGGGSPLRGKT